VGREQGWLHGDCDAARFISDVAIAVFTGTDDLPEPKGSARAILDSSTTPDKIYANMTDATHMDGCSPLWAGFAAAFFQVHLNGEGPGTPYYERVYGEGTDSLCGGHYPMAHCEAPEAQMWAQPLACAQAFEAATADATGG
jgi:hypothetical protein